MKRRWRFTSGSIGVVLALAILPFAIAIADIIGGIVDNELGIVTGQSIRNVRAYPEGASTIGAAVARLNPAATWTAKHDDDDSLLSVRVTAGSAEWCVWYDVSPGVVLP